MGDQAGTIGDQAGTMGDQAGTIGDHVGTMGGQAGTNRRLGWYKWFTRLVQIGDQASTNKGPG